jgi:hypothetical protein
MSFKIGSDNACVNTKLQAASGQLLHEAQPGGFVDLRAQALLAYVDLEPYLRRIGESIRAAVQRRA